MSYINSLFDDNLSHYSSMVYSWDFDFEMFYIFEIEDWEKIDGVMYASTPFSKDFILSESFFNTRHITLIELRKKLKTDTNWKKYLKCPVVFYSFNNRPEILGKLKQIL